MSEDYGNDFIVLTDEDGNEIELEHLSTLEYEAETYMAFVEANPDPETILDPDSAELIILKVIDEDESLGGHVAVPGHGAPFCRRLCAARFFRKLRRTSLRFQARMVLYHKAVVRQQR